MNKVVAETQKNAEFDKKYPPLVKTKALIDEGLVDRYKPNQYQEI